MRRTLCQSLGGLFGLIGLNACSQPRPKQIERVYTEEEKQRLYKFRGVEGGQWVLSSVHELRWIEIRNQDDRVIDAPAGVSPGSRSRFSLSSIPIRLKVIWREQDPNNPIYSGKRGEEWSGGKIIASFEIPVADRIPDALLDDLRRDPRGGLRIKIRLHREGVLLGWDIARVTTYPTRQRHPDTMTVILFMATAHRSNRVSPSSGATTARGPKDWSVITPRAVVQALPLAWWI